jgi:hypothetical protein
VGDAEQGVEARGAVIAKPISHAAVLAVADLQKRCTWHQGDVSRKHRDDE